MSSMQTVLSKEILETKSTSASEDSDDSYKSYPGDEFICSLTKTSDICDSRRTSLATADVKHVHIKIKKVPTDAMMRKLEKGGIAYHPEEFGAYLERSNFRLYEQFTELSDKAPILVLGALSLKDQLNLANMPTSIPSDLLFDVCIFSHTSPMVFLSFITGNGNRRDCMAYNSQMARAMTVRMRREGIKFSIVSGVFDETCSQSLKSSVEKMKWTASLTGFPDSLDMNTHKLEIIISTFMTLLPDPVLAPPAAPGDFSGIAINLVLVGRGGSGKSSTGNTLLGRKYFESFAVKQHTASSIRSSSFLHNNHARVQIFDVPVKSEDDVSSLNELGKMCSEGVHAFLFTVHICHTLPKNNVNFVEKLKKHFGKDWVNYGILIFTGEDNLAEDEMSLEEYIQSRTSVFRRMVKEFEERRFTVNNRCNDETRVVGFRNSLIDMVFRIQDQNDGKSFALRRVKTHQHRQRRSPSVTKSLGKSQTDDSSSAVESTSSTTGHSQNSPRSSHSPKSTRSRAGKTIPDSGIHRAMSSSVERKAIANPKSSTTQSPLEWSRAQQEALRRDQTQDSGLGEEICK